MTTSFSQLMHGNLVEAFHANAGGVVLALVCALQVPWCWWSAFRGRMAAVSDPTRGLVWILVAVGGVTGVNWLFQLMSG